MPAIENGLIHDNPGLKSKEKQLNMQPVGAYPEVMDLWLRKSRGELLPDRNLVVVFTAGMRRGGIIASQLSELQKLGFTPEGIQAIVGSSVGATLGREYIGNNIDALKALFADDFIDTPIGRQRGIFLKKSLPPLVDFVTTEDLFRKVGANEDAVKTAPTNLYMGLRRMENGKTDFYNTDYMDDTVVGAISSMTINFITKRRHTPIRNGNDQPTMFADPLHGDRNLIDFAKSLNPTDLLIFFTSNPFVKSRFDSVLRYALTSIENMQTPKKLFAALYDLQATNESKEYYQQLFADESGINIAGLYPQQIPMAPNELDLERVQDLMDESGSFAKQIGSSIKNRTLSLIS